MAHLFKFPAFMGQRLADWRQAPLLDSVREYFRYHGVLAPLVRVMRAVDFRHKAMLVAAAFAIPTTIVVSIQLNDQWSAWRKARVQSDGWAYVHQVDKLITAVIPRRGALEGVPAGQPLPPNSDADRDIEQSYLALATLQDQIGNRFAAQSEWLAVNKAYVQLDSTAAMGDARVELHNRLIVLAQALTRAVSDGAQLSLNADRGIHLTSEIATDYLPHLDEAVDRLHSRLRPLLKQAERTPEQAEATLVAAADLQQTLAQLQANTTHIAKLEGTQCVRGNEPLFADGDKFARSMRAVALDANNPVDLVEASLSARNLHQALRQLRGGCLTHIDTAIAANEAQVGQRLGWLCGMIALGMALSTYAMIAFSRVMRGGMMLIQSEVARMARGDLSSRALARGDDEVAHTLRNLRTSLARLADLFTVVRRGVASVSHASGDISTASEALALRINEATDAMSGLQQGIAATLDYLEANEQCVARAVDRAKDVTADAGRSRRAMTHLAEVIENLQRRSREIGKIVSLIDGIAFQTNLLALNASVEAAKAGASGKGFAVVASEVRGLAQRVADAAAQISKVVGDSTNEITLGQEIAQSTMEAVHSTEANVCEMGRILTRLALITADGRQNAEQMTSTLSQVNDNSDKTSHLVTQVAHAAKELRHQSLKLAEQSSKFKLG